MPDAVDQPEHTVDKPRLGLSHNSRINKLNGYGRESNLGKDVFIKVPVNETGIKTIKTLKEHGYRVTATVIYTLQQAIFASSVGADYVAPYFNHICDHIGDASAIIREMAQTFKMHNKSTKILAASFRNTSQIITSILSGAEAVTLSPEMFSSMMNNPSVDATISKFSNAWFDMYGEKKIYELS